MRLQTEVINTHPITFHCFGRHLIRRMRLTGSLSPDPGAAVSTASHLQASFSLP